jgi:hypothetical protein
MKYLTTEQLETARRPAQPSAKTFKRCWPEALQLNLALAGKVEG